MRQYDSCCKKCNNCNTVVSANYEHTTTNNVQKMHVVMIPQQYEAVWKSRTNA